MPGMDVHAQLTVVGDGPIGAVGQRLDEKLGLPKNHHQRDWAVGMKMVIDLPEHCDLAPGTVIHTMGYPEPEILGFLYVHPDRIASFGVFVPSTFDSPVRTAYRYLQHWMLHPYLWHHLEGGTLRSWGAKTLQESGRLGEPYLVGDGFARVGEGSGSTNMLTGSGVDEAWMTGVLLAEGVTDLLKQGKPFTKDNLQDSYVNRRRKSWVEKDAKVAEHARDGFRKGFIAGALGMAISGLTGGFMNFRTKPTRSYERTPTLEEYFRGRISREEIAEIREACATAGTSLHDALMTRAGWHEITYDGKLLVSQQDALLMGGKVQAPAGYADHVTFVYPHLCEHCETKLCIEACSAQAIMPSPEGGVPTFDREKCIHCGACVWNCSKPGEGDADRLNVRFLAGAGGLHSAEN
jgi:electron-transferring-flavoprotein dehydrogenase